MDIVNTFLLHKSQHKYTRLNTQRHRWNIGYLTINKEIDSRNNVKHEPAESNITENVNVDECCENIKTKHNRSRKGKCKHEEKFTQEIKNLGHENRKAYMYWSNGIPINQLQWTMLIRKQGLKEFTKAMVESVKVRKERKWIVESLVLTREKTRCKIIIHGETIDQVLKLNYMGIA